MTFAEQLVRKGRQEGLQQGRQEGHQEAMQAFALHLLKENATDNQIMALTGLSLEVIQALKAKVTTH
ncbi:MAG: hypothetical protein K0Q74_445 [Gammaproteobacteria bacterium]|jgi:predicted transposase/invertase (TIGR01784 family)|nr:hypothetical protein [Gammaproteobacteria bacterium]